MLARAASARRSSSRGAGWPVLLGILGLHPAAGLGAGAAEPAKVQARSLKGEAERLRAEGRPREALGRYQEAYRLLPTPLLLWPQAELHLLLGQAEEGLRALQGYQDGVQPEFMPTGQGMAEVAVLREKLRELQRPKAPVVAPVVVVAQPAAAEKAEGRPLWRYLVGGAGVLGGLALVGVGGAALYANERCPGSLTPGSQEACASVFDTAPLGGALVGVGAAVVVGGVVLLALPAKRGGR